MRPLTPKMIEVLRALSEKGNFAHYMPYRGRFNQNPYYFLHGRDVKNPTAQIRGLVARGLAERFHESKFSDDHRVRISAAGRKYLRSLRRIPGERMGG